MAGCTLWLFGPRLHAGVFRLLEATSPRLSRSANDYFQIPTGRVVEAGTQVTIQGVSVSIPIIGRCPPAHHGLKPVVAPCPKSADERYEIAWNQQISPGCLLG
jgi:hypothetical protein